MANVATETLALRIRKYAVRVGVIVVVTLIMFVIIGGGYGDKPPLPDHLLSAGAPLLIAHRGAHSEPGSYTGIPDNSAAAIIRAMRRGYHWIEVDVQYSADSVFFLLHDFDGSRLLRSDIRPSELSFAEISENTITSNNISTDEHVISLDSAVALIGDSAHLYLDMKGYGHESSTEQARDIAAYLERHDLTSRVIVASPDILFISYLEWRNPEIVTLLERFRPPSATFVQWLPRGFRPDMYANYYRHITPALVEKLTECDLMDRFVVFHTDSVSFFDAYEWGAMRFMVDDGAYLDEFLTAQPVSPVGG